MAGLFTKYNLKDLDALVFSSYYFGTINHYLNSPRIDREDQKTLLIMLSNYQWIEKVKLTNENNMFENILLFLIRHRFNYLGLLACTMQRLRRRHILKRKSI